MSADPPKYWGGAKPSPSTIRPLDAENFKQLVERQVNVPVRINLTREEFLAKSKDERDALKSGPYMIACSFKPGTANRNDANVHQLTTLFFDADGGEIVKLFNANPELIGERVWPFSYAAYHTANSTPENPRMRFMFDVVPCDPKHQRRLVRYIAKRLGMPRDFKGVVESTVKSQPMFRPNSFIGSEDTSPVIGSRTDGQAIDIADIPEEEPEEGEVRNYAYEGDDFDADYGLAYMPLQGITVEDIEPALRVIDPDCLRPIWCEVIAGLRHQFRDPEQAHAAFDLLVDWSSGGTKYKVGEPEHIWFSFRPDATGKAPVTIKSLFHHAIQAGWCPKKVSSKIEATCEEWILSCTDLKQLMDEGCQRIAAMPFPNSIMEDNLTCALLKQIQLISNRKIEKASVKRQIAAARYQKKVEAAGTDPPDWLRGICYISTLNVFHNIATGIQITPAAFDNFYGEKLVPKDGESESAKSGRPAVPPVQFALNLIRIDRVDETIYCPLHGAAADPFIEFQGKKYLNTYLPSSIPLEDPENSEAAGELFCNHFRILIPEPEYQDLLINFLCHLVQFPGKKIRWCGLIQSAEGVGKGFLGKIMMAVLGKKNVKVISPEVLRSQWNDWLIGSVLNILDEIHMPGQTRETVMNNLKMAISDDFVTINKRNTSACDQPNFTNFIGFTNFKDCLHLKESDRRWSIFQSALQFKEQVEALTLTGHFEKLDILLGPWAGALRHWMMNRAIPADFPVDGPAPVTRYRNEVVEASRNALQASLQDIIRDGDNPLIQSDVIAYAEAEDRTRFEARNAASLTHYLRTLGFSVYQDGRKFDIDGRKTAIWTHDRLYFPEIEDADELLRTRLAAQGDRPL